MLCRIYKWFIDCCIDDDKPLGAFTAGHIRRCANCRGYYEAQSKTADTLAESPISACQPSESAVSRIMQSLPAEKSRTKQSAPSAPHFRGWAVAAAAVVLVAVGLFALIYSIDPTPQDQPSVELTTPGEVEEQLRASLPLNDVRQYYALETELQNISEDARAAAAFLLDCTGIMGSYE